MRPRIRIAVTGIFLAAASTETPFAAGVDISWDECVVDLTPVETKYFSCTGTTNETYSLVLQFKSAEPIENVLGITAYVALTAPAPAHGTMQPFWHYEMGGCNRTPISGVAIRDELPASCEAACYQDLWGTDGSLGYEAISQYVVRPEYRGEASGRFAVNIVRPTGNPTRVEAGTNYYACHLVFNNRNRDACAGCDQGVRIIFEEVVLDTPERPYSLAGNDKWSNCALINTEGGCGLTAGSSSRLAGLPPCATPAVRTSWASMKTLYR